MSRAVFPCSYRSTVPPEMVTVIVTELGLLPPSSVPVVIRETRKELQASGL